MLEWNDLWAACALYLIIEGLRPFLNPGALKQALLQVAPFSLNGPVQVCAPWGS